MLRRARRIATDEAGFSLLVSLLVSVIVLALGLTWTSIGAHSVNASGREELKERARNAAEAGLNLAMAYLSTDRLYTGQALTTSDGAQYEVLVENVYSDPLDGTRKITATAYAPSQTAPRRVVRKLSQQVVLVPIDGFRYALFASPLGITTANNLTLTGDSYSTSSLSLSNNQTINGNVTTLGSLTTTGNTVINGMVRAVGGVTFGNSASTLNGDLYSGGNVSVTGTVKGSVQAAGTITAGATNIEGSRNANSPPPAPAPQTLPEYDWAAADLAPFTQWDSPELFQIYWDANKDHLSGQHRVHCGVTCNAILFNSRWTVEGDLTLVTDSQVVVSRDVVNNSSSKYTVAIISAAEPASGAAIAMTNQTDPANVKLLLFAPNGSVTFGQKKSFNGVAYAESIVVDQHFSLTFSPIDVAGFDWSLASTTHYQVVAGPFRDVPTSG